jgi:CRISPR-associated exonuclease Cas4
VDYTQALEQSLLELLTEMKRDEFKREVARSHEQASRCKKCGFREVCDQKVA